MDERTCEQSVADVALSPVAGYVCECITWQGLTLLLLIQALCHMLNRVMATAFAGWREAVFRRQAAAVKAEQVCLCCVLVHVCVGV
jgi:hypothetical protein